MVSELSLGMGARGVGVVVVEEVVNGEVTEDCEQMI